MIELGYMPETSTMDENVIQQLVNMGYECDNETIKEETTMENKDVNQAIKDNLPIILTMGTMIGLIGICFIAASKDAKLAHAERMAKIAAGIDPDAKPIPDQVIEHAAEIIKLLGGDVVEAE